MTPAPDDFLYEDAPPPAREPLVDREARNPYLRWLTHLGIPVSVSLSLHALLLVLLAWQTWRAFAPRQTDEIAYEVTVAPVRDARPGLDWSQGADVGDPFAPPPPPLAQATEITGLDVPPTLRAGEPDEGGFGLGEAGRSGVLGSGGGAGAGGGEELGSGFGGDSGLGDARIWSVRARGKTFVYVIDFSGSIIVVADRVRRELKRSVGQLGPQQMFDVVVYYGTAAPGGQERMVVQSFAPAPVPADADNKRRFFAWIGGVRPQGPSDPLPAMRRALAMQPDALFLFSDGDFRVERPEQQIAAANTRRAQIHCLVFDELLLDNPQRLTVGARAMERIARDSGGECKVITRQDLGE